LYGGLYDPYWWWDSGSAYDQQQEYEIGLANEMNQQSLEEQSARRQVDQDVYARSAPLPPRDKQRTEVVPDTVLVFRDQHKQEVQNYAIVGPTLWNFAPQHTQKIPLSDLDLPATTKANDERGVDFRLPGAHEGQ
jgi:Ni,Fe-hydrogenase I large subunit